MLKGSRLLTALPTAKVLATEASRGSAKAPTPGGAGAGESGGSSTD